MCDILLQSNRNMNLLPDIGDLTCAILDYRLVAVQPGRCLAHAMRTVGACVVHMSPVRLPAKLLISCVEASTHPQAEVVHSRCLLTSAALKGL